MTSTTHSPGATRSTSSGGFARLNMAALAPVLIPNLPRPVAQATSTESPAVPLHETYLRAFGASAYLGIVGGDPGLLEEAKARLTELERKWSPAGPDSEIVHLRTRPGVAVRVSTDTILLADLDGRRHWKPRTFYVDVPHHMVGLLSDAVQDPNGLDDLASALATDLVVTDLLRAKPTGVCVRVGKSMRAVGVSPRGAGWLAQLDPAIRLQRGGLSSLERGGRESTVVADLAWRAHLLAGTALALTDEYALEILGRRCLAGRLVAENGEALTVGDWESVEQLASRNGDLAWERSRI